MVKENASFIVKSGAANAQKHPELLNGLEGTVFIGKIWGQVCRVCGEGNGNPLQNSCLENSVDRIPSLVGCCPWGRTESNTIEAT